MNVSQIKNVVKPLNNTNIDFYTTMLENLENKQSVEVVFSGTLSNGKSSVINAILGEDLLQTGIGSTTAKITYISKGINSLVGIDSNENEIKKDFSKENIKQLNADEEIELVKITKDDFKYQNITFVDSPGINDINKIREDISYAYVPSADVVVFVLDISKGITADEKAFFDDKIIKTHKDKIFILLNGLDKVEGEDLTPILQNPLLADFKVYPLSAKQYLSGIVSNDEVKKEKSQFNKFLVDFHNYIESINSYELLQTRVLKAKKSIKELALLQINTQLENLSKSKDEIEIQLNEQKQILVSKEAEVQQIIYELEKDITDIKKYATEQINELKKLQENKINFDDFMQQTERTINLISQYSGDKLKGINIEIDIVTNIMATLTKYFDEILMVLNMILAKFPKIAILKLALEKVPFIKPYLDKGSSYILENKINSILSDINYHFDKEITKLQKEQKEELEYTVLAKVKTTIQAMENSLIDNELKKENIVEEINFLQTKEKEVSLIK
jgi:GTP-binding protein EngB required for normal cell division